MFGNLIVRWTPRRVQYKLDPHDDRWQSQPYEVVASDAESVVIRTPDPVTGGEPRLYQLLFDEDRDWITVWPGLPEAFRRIG